MNIFNNNNLSKICCGCRACEAICPTNYINIKQNNEGFLYPFISQSSNCINCALCTKVCPIINVRDNNNVIEAYGLTHKDIDVTNNSASGGAFTAFADYILERNGYIFGCTLDEQLYPKTIGITNKNDLNLLRSSKYVQCDTNNSYITIKSLLEEGKHVLYCSTPCQIAGLKNFLQKDYKTLFTIDLFCHGVPSIGLFKRYLSFLATCHKTPITSLTFRDGHAGWGTVGYYVAKKHYNFNGTDPYYNAFLLGKTYGMVCYDCCYAMSHRPGDVTIGDFWGVLEEHTNIDISKGVSAILINTDRGKFIFDSIKNNTNYFSTSFEKIARHNHVLLYPTPFTPERDEIYEAYKKLDFKKFVKQYLKPRYTLKQTIGQILYKIHNIFK